MNRTINSIWKLFGAMTLAILAVAVAVGGQQMDRSKLQGGGRTSGSSGKEGWRILEPVTYENMSVFPVVASNTRSTDDFITLDEGLSSGAVTVSERGSAMIRRTRDGHPAPAQYSGASVNELVLVNHGTKPLILLAGEMVSGGKQDRIIGKDRIVPVGADPLPLDVFCVEHGRWSNGENFSAANTMVHPSVREKAAVDQQQTEVWAAVRNGSNASASGQVLSSNDRIFRQRRTSECCECGRRCRRWIERRYNGNDRAAANSSAATFARHDQHYVRRSQSHSIL